LQVSFQLIPNVLGQIQGGQLRPLAITANKRSEVLPGVPTVAEVGMSGYEAYGWFAMLAPKNTPAPMIARLHAAYMKAMS
ncbi:Bug family tripartite tricarboxylate transporter substrate binding protein, partial [Klebsiella pneumoniae]|uniref:Bug family tripartite tricarboxylate transporter substrate binding protein n=1 Tax=Klebsiella pneumoniae TaxID=573 RepID=UPI00222E0A0C